MRTKSKTPDFEEVIGTSRNGCYAEADYTQELHDRLVSEATGHRRDGNKYWYWKDTNKEITEWRVCLHG